MVKENPDAAVGAGFDQDPLFMDPLLARKRTLVNAAE